MTLKEIRESKGLVQGKDYYLKTKPGHGILARCGRVREFTARFDRLGGSGEHVEIHYFRDNPPSLNPLPEGGPLVYTWLFLDKIESIEPVEDEDYEYEELS